MFLTGPESIQFHFQFGDAASDVVTLESATRIPQDVVNPEKRFAQNRGAKKSGKTFKAQVSKRYFGITKLNTSGLSFKVNNK